jgi:hypothetical protein
LFCKKKETMKKLASVTVFLLTISLLLASCTTFSYQCNDPLGCLEISPDSPLVIGAILATSGDNGSAGTASLQMVEEAVAKKDLLLGHPLKLYHYGTDCTVDSVREAATQFATYPELSAVVGPSCAEEEAVADQILQEAGIPLVGPVPDSTIAYAITNQVLAAIEQVAVLAPDKTLYVPRQALFDALHISR